MGNIVGGDLRTQLIIDACFFGAFGALQFLWVLTTRRGYLRPMLWAFVLASFLRVLLPIAMLWSVGNYPRGDGVEVSWLRFAFYIAIYALALPFGYTEYLNYDTNYHKWTTAISLALTMVGPLAATLVQYEETRIFFIAAAFVPFLFANACLWWYRRAKIHVDPNHQAMPWNHILFLLLAEAGWLGGAVVFILGHAFTRKITFVQENYGFFGVDVLLYILLPLFAKLMHCECPVIGHPAPLAKDKKVGGAYAQMEQYGVSV